jgi:protocatechuate 3,4-dioxygenase beta subunit
MNNENKVNLELKPESFTRRNFLKTSAIFTATAFLAACGLSSGTKNITTSQTASTTAEPVKPAILEPTAQCGVDHEPSPALTEGPYFTPNSPERSSLLSAGMEGTKLTISGYVLATDCTPIKHALLDFWHANDKGEYDNTGYTLRGHQYTNDQGKFTLETIVPGLYTGRTRHIHVKAQAPNQAILTTQLFFPNEPDNANDSIYNKTLEMVVKENADKSKSATINFILDIG